MCTLFVFSVGFDDSVAPLASAAAAGTSTASSSAFLVFFCSMVYFAFLIVFADVVVLFDFDVVVACPMFSLACLRFLIPAQQCCLS